MVAATIVAEQCHCAWLKYQFITTPIVVVVLFIVSFSLTVCTIFTVIIFMFVAFLKANIVNIKHLFNRRPSNKTLSEVVITSRLPF